MALNLDYRCGWWREKQQKRRTSFQIEAQMIKCQFVLKEHQEEMR